MRGWMRSRLQLAGWPPPLAGGAGGGPAPWAGLQAADADLLAQLQHLLSAFISLQRACDPAAFSQVAPAFPAPLSLRTPPRVPGPARCAGSVPSAASQLLKP